MEHKNMKQVPVSGSKADGLRDCPFCGCDQIHSGYHSEWAIPNTRYCRNCRAYGPHKQTEQESIDAWNERVADEDDDQPRYDHNAIMAMLKAKGLDKQYEL